ncbi:hypothetical protein [Phreatobacter sp. AB_2022a]|nr:hypothetical protein [Phreatobacter sp. AB_2022a]MCZ0737513.1 hypothetical protein [Phreatobacter sp. AB_2022a]
MRHQHPPETLVPVRRPPGADLRRHGLALVIAANGIGIALAAALAALLRV